MAIDVKSLSAKALKSLAAQIKNQQSALSKRKPIAVVRKKLTMAAKADGYTIAELFGARSADPRSAAKKAGKKVATRKVAPKYRNPASPKDTWTGRGKQPLWLVEQLKKGKKAEDFLIKK